MLLALAVRKKSLSKSGRATIPGEATGRRTATFLPSKLLSLLTVVAMRVNSFKKS